MAAQDTEQVVSRWAESMLAKERFERAVKHGAGSDDIQEGFLSPGLEWVSFSDFLGKCAGHDGYSMRITAGFAD
jgi:hypothetical protein